MGRRARPPAPHITAAAPPYPILCITHTNPAHRGGSARRGAACHGSVTPPACGLTPAAVSPRSRWRRRGPPHGGADLRGRRVAAELSRGAGADEAGEFGLGGGELVAEAAGLLEGLGVVDVGAGDVDLGGGLAVEAVLELGAAGVAEAELVEVGAEEGEAGEAAIDLGAEEPGRIRGAGRGASASA